MWKRWEPLLPTLAGKQFPEQAADSSPDRCLDHGVACRLCFISVDFFALAG